MRYRAAPAPAPFSLGAYVDRWFPGGSGDERVVACPACGVDAAGRPQAHVNVRRGVWVCKRASCGARGSARDFVRLHLGVDGDELARVMSGEDYAAPASPYDAARLRRMLRREPPGAVTPAGAPGSLPFSPALGYRPLPADSVLGREAWAYLTARGVTPGQIATHRIGVATRGRLSGRAVLPVFSGGALVYYVARALSGGGDRKYLNPENGEMPATASEVLFGLDVAELYGRGVLVEGYFDKLAEDDAAGAAVGVATFGSTLSASQLALVAAAHRRRPMDWVVKRDGDGSVPLSSAFEMARQLAAAGARSVRVDVPVGDPGDRLGVAWSATYSLAGLVAARVGA